MFISRFASTLVVLTAFFLFAAKPLSAQAAQPVNPGDATGLNSEDDEANLHGRAWVRLIETDLIQEKFDGLDRMAAQFRSEKTASREESGNLHIFMTRSTRRNSPIRIRRNILPICNIGFSSVRNPSRRG